MDIRNMLYASLRGFCDSVYGMGAAFRIDSEINERLKSRLSPTHSSTPVRRRDSDIREETPVRTLKKHEESNILKRITQCALLNGVLFLFSILLFDYIVLPITKSLLLLKLGDNDPSAENTWSWIHLFFSILFKTVWVAPLLLLCKVVNSLWFQDIADSVYRHSRGKPIFMQGLSKLFADLIFSLVIEVLFLLQATLVYFIPIPILGQVLSIVHTSLLYSLYAFEYKWINMGWELYRRLYYVEMNWPYFLGFGMPLTLLTYMTDSWVISGCIFSILFPFFIISGNEASPVDNDCVFPLRLFSLVIALSNWVLAKTIGITPQTPSISRSSRSSSVDSQRLSSMQGSRSATGQSARVLYPRPAKPTRR